MIKSSQVDVVGVGLNATDTLIRLPQYPAVGSKVEFHSAAVAAGWARAAGVPVVADLDDVYPGVDALLKNIDYLITSRDIPGRLVGEQDLRKSLPVLWSQYGCRLTAATLGQQGVLAWDG